MDAETDNQNEESTPNEFELDGKTYTLPELRELDIDEWMLVYKYSKVVLRDLMEITDDPVAEMARRDKLEQPGVMKALFHIAYKRAHPKKTDAAVEALVGQIKYLPTLEAMEGEEEESEEEDPTEEMSKPESEPSEPTPSSERSFDSSIGNGSSDSSTSLETLEDQPATTGISG